MRYLVLLGLLPVLAGCSATVTLEAAEDANNPYCAEVMVRLPDEISGFTQRFTNAQATSAWGDPTVVLFRCGLEEARASELPCVTASDIDWLVDDSNAPSYRFISFSTRPAVEVIVDSRQVSGVSTLEAIAAAVSQIPQSNRCSLPG